MLSSAFRDDSDPKTSESTKTWKLKPLEWVSMFSRSQTSIHQKTWDHLKWAVDQDVPSAVCVFSSPPLWEAELRQRKVQRGRLSTVFTTKIRLSWVRKTRNRVKTFDYIYSSTPHLSQLPAVCSVVCLEMYFLPTNTRDMLCISDEFKDSTWNRGVSFIENKTC